MIMIMCELRLALNCGLGFDSARLSVSTGAEVGLSSHGASELPSSSQCNFEIGFVLSERRTVASGPFKLNG
eukprot:2084255-Rhodomonas_salina.1